MTVIEFPKRTTVLLNEEDYCLVLRMGADGSLSTQFFTPVSIVEASQKDANIKAPLEYILMCFFELAIHNDDVLASVLDLVDEYMDEMQQNPTPSGIN